MADEKSAWTPAEVRGLVKDVLQWALLVLTLLYARDGQEKAAEADKRAAVVGSQLKQTRVLMGLPPEPKE